MSHELFECHLCHLWFEETWLDAHLVEDHDERPEDYR